MVTVNDGHGGDGLDLPDDVHTYDGSSELERQIRSDELVGSRWKSLDTFGWVNEIEVTGEFDYMAGGWEYCFLKVNGHRVKGRKTKRISHKSLMQFFERMPDA